MTGFAWTFCEEMGRILKNLWRSRLKVPVHAVGWQHDINDKPAFLLVNEPSGSTVTYNPRIHSIKSVKKGVTI